MSETPFNITQLIMSPKTTLENLDDVDSDSDDELPFMQAVTKEELRLSRVEKRAQKKAEKHGKAEVFRRMGDELFSKEKYQEAYIPYLEAVEIWPSNFDYYIKLALTYSKLGWYEEAAHASTRALTLDPKSIEARYLRGVARLEQRLLRAAKTDLEIVTTHDATHKRANDALQSVLKALEAGFKLGNHTISLDTAPTPAETSEAGVASTEAVETVVPELDFSYPHYDDQALEMDTLSNTSDCNHRGNGVPCRFYNRAGCAKASLCPFSHAPDEKSVRDDLGRNVCIYFLLDACKFGSAKCVYSHARFYLPKEHGWWNSEEETAKVKSILELSEKTVKERRSYVSQLQMLARQAKKEAKKTAALPSKPPKTPKTPKLPKAPKADAGKETGEKKDDDKEAGEKETGSKDGEKKRSSKRSTTRKGGKSRPKRPAKSEASASRADAISDEGSATAVSSTGLTQEKKEDDAGLTTEYKLPSEARRSDITPEPDVVLSY